LICVCKLEISCHHKDLGGKGKPLKAILAPLPVKVFETTAGTSKDCASWNAVRRRAHAHQAWRHGCTETRRRNWRRHWVLHHACETRRFALLLLSLEDVGNVREALWVAHVWCETRRWASLRRSLVLNWRRLHEGEIRRELRLWLLLRHHARHTGMPTHAAVRWWLLLRLLRTLCKVATLLLHLLLHEHSVLIKTWRRTCGYALGRPAA
jgi:hypothetical protein